MDDWNFLDYMMDWMGFRSKWCGWINSCVLSAGFSIIINGSPKVFFQSSRGLHQVDPLSPSLFVIVVETLHAMFVTTT